MQNRPSNQPVPTWVVVVGIIAFLSIAIGVFGNSPEGERRKAEMRAKEAQKASETRVANPGEKAFKSQLLGYTQADDGRILVAYVMTKAERRSIHAEIKAFMRQLMDDKVEFTTAAISAHGYVTDAYGKRSTAPAYTIVIPYDQAIKVESWPFVDLEAIGTVQYANETLR